MTRTEVEYVAMADGVKEALYLRGDVAVQRPKLQSPCISVFEDRKGGKALAENPLKSTGSKHIDVRLRFVRELVADGGVLWLAVFEGRSSAPTL